LTQKKSLYSSTPPKKRQSKENLQSSHRERTLLREKIAIVLKHERECVRERKRESVCVRERERERERAANQQTVNHETTRKERERERQRQKNADNTEGGVSDS
jgi:hypothetical protein